MKMTKLSDVAKMAGVSIATVTRVVHNNSYVSQEKRKKVEQAIKELNYIPPKKESTTGGGNMVAVILQPSYKHPFSARIGYSLADYAYRAGMYAFMVVDYPTNKTIPALIKKILQQNVCGIVITGFVDSEIDAKTQELLLNCGKPVVIVERALCFGLNLVKIDTENGIRMATCHILEKGRKVPIYLTPPVTGDVERERLLGFKRGVEESGLKFHNDMVHICDTFSYQDGYKATKEAFKKNQNIDAIVVWSDTFACGALQYLHHTGKKVPDEVSVIGYDDFVAPLLTPPLSSVYSPLEEMARAAIDIIVNSQDSTVEHFSRTIKLSPKLVVRESS